MTIAGIINKLGFSISIDDFSTMNNLRLRTGASLYYWGLDTITYLWYKIFVKENDSYIQARTDDLLMKSTYSWQSSIMLFRITS